MRKTNKKGFTIVELVIVIAVIAILAAVLIPTYSSLVKKANESKDTQLIRNLNTALAADTNKHNNMTDALDAAAEFGYDVAKIVASATDNEILWDSKNDLFCYLKDGNIEYIPEYTPATTPDAVDYWQITDDIPAAAEQTYSIYYTGETLGDVTVSVGFDAGTSTGGTLTLKTDATQNITIRTSHDCTVTIEAGNASVYHYGEAKEVTVTKVAPNSYHVYGKVGVITIESGRVVAESGSNIFFLHAKGSSQVDNNSGNIQNGCKESGVTGSGASALNGEETDKETAKSNYNAAVTMNGKYYATVSAALSEVESKYGDGYVVEADTTMVLQRDITEDGIKVKEGVTFTIDFNGFSWDVNGTVGSAGTPTNGMQFLKGATVVLKNGTLKTTAGASQLIQNYSNLTLENMVIDAREGTSCNYAISNNHGNVVISNSTIYAKEGKCAFDVYSFGSYTGANVTVKNNSVINGKIEIGQDNNANVDSLALKLESCTHNGTWDIATESLSDKVTKKADLNIAAPEGYTWGTAENGYQTLQKAQ